MSKVGRLPHRQSRAPRGAKVQARLSVEEIEAREERERRRLEALAEVQRERERLERRIAREKVQPAVGPALGAGYEAPQEVTEPEPVDIPAADPMLSYDIPLLVRRFPDLPWEGEGNQP